ncbi:hypothetical protein AAVH_34847 [Aphelenchoides avenae]|nr:hypothetical protein AAVH_34847 [Aphelenchus avenae]
MNNSRCETWEELTIHLRHSRIERVVFKGFITFDEDILAKLKPLSQCWLHASIRLLWPFSSADVLRTALSEVLLCQGLEIVTAIPSEQVEALGTSLLVLPALQRCQSLLIARSVGQATFTAREIFDWLHLPNGHSNKKYLRISYSAISDALVTLVTDLLKDFKEADTPCPFEIEVFETPTFDRRLVLDKSMNDRTLESFTVIFDTDNLASIERKPVLEVSCISLRNIVLNE